MNFSRLVPALLVFPLLAQTRTAIDNDQVRVLVMSSAPQQKSVSEEHAWNRVMIYLDAGRERFTYDDGRVKDVVFRANEVRWRPAGQYASENTGERPFRAIEVELKNAGGPFQPPALDTVKLWPKFFDIPIDNLQARVLVAHVPAHQKFGLHEHGLPRVLINLTDQDFRVVDEAGRAAEINMKAGGIHWAKPNRHMEENLSDQPFEGVVVEVK